MDSNVQSHSIYGLKPQSLTQFSLEMISPAGWLLSLMLLTELPLFHGSGSTRLRSDVYDPDDADIGHTSVFTLSVISGLQRICMIILSGCLMLCITIRSIDCGIPAARLVRVGQSAIAICSMIFLTGQTQSMSWTTMSSILFGRTLIWHSHSTLNSCLCPLQWHTEAYCDVSYLFETKAVGTLETWMIEDISSPSHPYLIGQMWDSGIQMRNLSEGIV